MTDKPLAWVGGAALPKPVKAAFGFQLRQVQQGRPAEDAKTLTQFGPGVIELRTSFDTNAYRTVYVVKLKHAIYVLHAFMKKSKSGIGLSKRDSELIASRLKRAREMDAELS